MKKYYTKATTVYIMDNKNVNILYTEDKNGDIIENGEEYSLIDTVKKGMKYKGRSYNLPANCIALEVFSDYLVVVVGVGIKRNFDLQRIVAIARKMSKGLALLPSQNIDILYDIDKLITFYNKLNNYPSVQL